MALNDAVLTRKQHQLGQGLIQDYYNIIKRVATAQGSGDVCEAH